MKNLQAELSMLFDQLKTGQFAKAANVVRPIANPAAPDVVPEIVSSDANGDVLRVPSNSGAGYEQYSRRVGEPWVRGIARNNQVNRTSQSDPLNYFASQGVVDAARRVLIEAFTLSRQAFPNDDDQTITEGLKLAFTKLNASATAVTAIALIGQYGRGRA